MKMKSIVTAMLAAGTFGAIAETAQVRTSTSKFSLQPVTEVKTLRAGSGFSVQKTGKKKAEQVQHLKNNYHDGTATYIIRLTDDAVTSYKGGVKGYEAVNKAAAKNVLDNAEFNAKSEVAQKYASYLDKKQTEFATKASSKIGRSVPELKRLKYAINGLITQLTHAEANAISKMPEVAFIEKEFTFQLDTDTGPQLIGAPAVWDGSAGAAEYEGEGVVIGVLDTGVNTDHDSFAATGGDGYTVVNPLGDGNYVGDCVADASLCNSKLIGVRSYPSVTDVYDDPVFGGVTRPANGEDYDGHGSHTASTAGGNVLLNVPYVVPDVLAGDTSDGIVTSYTFDRMSGVAPHANIISYQVCLPGSNGDTHSGCSGAAILAGIDDAITDDVDVINYSIGPSSGPLFSPWTSSTEIGFLNAQAAGIFVATSAGNSGPAPSTTYKAAAWYTSVAASNHGNAGVAGDDKSIGTFSGGDTAAPADISGGGLNGSFTGDIVYAGDFTNPNDPGGDPAQCLEPFPAGTFTATQIVVCDRGAIARVAKGANAAAGGAGGFVLANIQGGATSIANDYYAVPGIHISAADGDLLKTWLSTGTGHQGTITAATLTRGTNTPDQLAGFSSRGPNDLGGVITPQVSAPGVSVYAAYSDEQPFKDQTGPAPADFSFLSGTSMASPHVAGAAALLTQAHPGWNVDQIRSALMMTSTTAVLKEDGTTPADFWDMGSGRIQVDQAINAGLVMSETHANYVAADPAIGGNPSTLNVPSMANSNCAATCSWTRTFTAINDGSYSLSVSDAAVSVEPATLDVVAGESYSVTVTADVSAMATGTEMFDTLVMTVTGQPDLHLPIYLRVNNGAVPDAVDMVAGRNDGSWNVEGIVSFPTDDLRITLDGLFDANATGFTAAVPFEIGVDPVNADYKDDLSVVEVFEFTVAANSVSMTVSISDATSPDFDLYIERDADGNGTWENIAGFTGATAATNESITINAPAAGNYRAIAQNYASANATDTGTLNVVVVPQTDPIPGLTIMAPTTSDGSPLDVKFLWDMDMAPGDAFSGDVTVAAGEVEIGTFPITLTRVEDDFSATTDATLVSRGDSIAYTLNINPSVYNQDQELAISVDMPANMSLDADSIVASGGVVTVKDPNAVGLDLTSDFSIAEDPTNNDYRDDLSQVHVFEFEVPEGTLSLTGTISDSTSPDNDLFIEFDSAGDGTYATRVAFAATALANETATAATPPAGMYRAIVQNWAGSGAAEDTGTLSITTVPATGEGFILNVNSLAPFPTYTATTAAETEACRTAGLGGWAGTFGYTGLSGFGIGTLGVSGDEASWGVFAGNTFNFYGREHAGLSFSDNGFVFFSGSAGSNAWNNLPIPNAAIPNDMLAGLWKDQILVDDGTRGVRAAGLGPISILDFDGLQPWNAAGDSTDRYYYQVQVMNDGVSDDHGGFGPYELIVSYAATQVGSLAGATAGVENGDGTVGVDTSAMIQAGGQICYDQIQFSQGYQVTFNVIPQAEILGQETRPMVTVTSDMEGTSDLTVVADSVELANVAPEANAGADRTYDRGDSDVPSQIVLTGEATLDRDEDHLGYTWLQTSGEDVDLSGSGSIEAFFNINDVPNGSYTFTLTVNDGEFMSSDQITITITGEESGNGSMGLFLLLGLPLLFRRRYSTK